MKNVLLSILTCVILADRLFAAAPGPTQFFVAPSGNDTWTGTQPEPTAAQSDGPFATVQRAVAAVRAAHQAAGGQVPGRPIIEVRGGTYYLAHTIELLPEDSGLILRAYRNERPVLSGGVAITNWQAGAEGPGRPNFRKSRPASGISRSSSSTTSGAFGPACLNPATTRSPASWIPQAKPVDGAVTVSCLARTTFARIGPA